MAFTAKLGTADSQLGNIVPGLGSDYNWFFIKTQPTMEHQENLVGWIDPWSQQDWYAPPRRVPPVYIGTPAGRQGPAPLVPIDPEAKKRTRSHQQVVASMLNSLYRRSEILMIEGQNYTLGYTPAEISDWSFNPPVTISEALDRLASGVAGGSGGTVTSVSVTTANGFSGTVANATTTPAITITAGDITPSSVAATGTVTGSNLSGTNTGDQTITLSGDVSGSGTGAITGTITAQGILAGRIFG